MDCNSGGTSAPTGNIIYLNGTSSAGKSSLAGALQAMLADPYLHFSLDRFNGMFPARYVSVQSFEEPIPPLASEGMVLRHEWVDDQLRLDAAMGPVARRFIAGMRQCVRALALAGNHVIVDDVLCGREFLAECVAALDGLPVAFIEVHCPLPEVARRERERGDRLLGLAAWQLPRIREDAVYDLTVDTGRDSPEECARRVARLLAAPPHPSAFERLRQSLAGESRGR